MKRKTAVLLVAALLAAAAPGCLVEEKAADTGTKETHGDVEFYTDYERAREKALKEEKPLLVYFWAPWCGYCEKYDENIFTHPKARDKIESYVPLAVDIEKDPDGLSAELGVRAPPTVLIVNPETEETMHRYVGYKPGLWGIKST